MSEDIYSIYHVYIARDLRETRMYYRHYTRERTTRIIHQPTPHTYHKYSDTRARWLKHVYRQVFVNRYKLDRGFIFKFGLKVILGVPCGLTKDIKYFSFFREEIVIVNAEFLLYLNPLIFKNRVYFIKQ